MSNVSTEGVVLRTYNLSDSDKIAVVLTQYRGIVRGYARGAKRLKSKFGSSLETLTVSNFSFYQKDNLELVRFEKAELLHSYFQFISIPEVFNAVSYWCELLLEFVQPNSPENNIYRMLTACLQAINADGACVTGLTRYLEVWLLKLSGFFPSISSCVLCGKKGTKDSAFAVKITGALCENCSPANTSEDKKLYALINKILASSPKTFVENYKKTDAAAMNKLMHFNRNLILEITAKA